MIVITPQTLTDIGLVSSSVPEPYTAAAWVSGTIYAVGAKVTSGANVYTCVLIPTAGTRATTAPTANPINWNIGGLIEATYAAGTTYGIHTSEVPVRVIRTTTHRVYESLVVSNVGNTPESSPTKWLDVGPTNRWCMFDNLRSTPTVEGTQITISMLLSKRVNSIGLIGLEGATNATISATLPDGTPYSRTVSLTRRLTLNWYDYFFSTATQISNYVLQDVPGFLGTTYTVTINGTSGLKCGGLIIGYGEYIGSTQRNAASEALNFSSITRDIYGNATMIQRRSIPKINQQLFLETARLNRVLKIREDLNAVPALWVGISDIDDPFYESLVIFGFYRTFGITLDNQIACTINLELEEL